MKALWGRFANRLVDHRSDEELDEIEREFHKVREEVRGEAS